jgi:hypothetical protein
MSAEPTDPTPVTVTQPLAHHLKTNSRSCPLPDTGACRTRVGLLGPIIAAIVDGQPLLVGDGAAVGTNSPTILGYDAVRDQ